ncbi:tyrosine-protein kinase YwqD [Robertmurraya siralis]|uniref:non-specific protein-tyrosine kinase n=1 Tax=Robertmurraya siralis TaxID=77777 RepID=A0A919WHC1_9BACI|nr:CpsD/CapB family tyrosine-protein kinase [Robertmurraya siralis]GIN62010.1 tyrosine-protein kinase YwqD [Robertmurraya siralis]
MSRKSRVREKKSGIPLVAYNYPREVISEQYRLIRTNILFASVDEEVKSIMITSSEPGDGKSTTAANLAIVLAQQGKKVLLVDADLRKPSIHYSFQLSNIFGLTSILTKDIDIDGAVSNSYIGNLQILNSGPIPPNPSELLNSKAMENLMKELNTFYDYVIYDTPPLLVVADPQIIANRCDGTVLVIASGKTQKDRALKAKELLVKAKSKILGVVVNGVESMKDEYYGR